MKIQATTPKNASIFLTDSDHFNFGNTARIRRIEDTRFASLQRFYHVYPVKLQA